MADNNNTGTSNSLYDYEFSVRESEPKRAEMLNLLKDRVKNVDKKEIISSDEYVEGESNFSEDKALSALLLYKLFPTKADLLKKHYTKEAIDGLLADLLAKYYLKDQIDSMLANLKNELAVSLGGANAEVTRLLNNLRDELNKHKNAQELDHPNGSVTNPKIRDGAITQEKLANDILKLLAGALQKSGGTMTGDIKFENTENGGSSIRIETGPGTGKYHRIGPGSTLEQIRDGKAHLDLGDYDGATYETNLCCVNRPGWYNSTTKEVKKFALQEEIEELKNQINIINIKLNGNSSNRGSIYKLVPEYAEWPKMRIDFLYRDNGLYVCDLYLCKVPKSFSGIYYHTQTQHDYTTGGSDDSHTERAYQTNVNIVLRSELADESNAFVFNERRSDTNNIEKNIFIKDGYICMRYGFRNRPDVEHNLVHLGNNFNFGIYIIS